MGRAPMRWPTRCGALGRKVATVADYLTTLASGNAHA